MGQGSDVVCCSSQLHLGHNDEYRTQLGLIVSPPDAKWKAPYSARFHSGASAPGG